MEIQDVVMQNYYLKKGAKLYKSKTKISKPFYDPARQSSMNKNKNPYTSVPDEYKGLPTFERVKIEALKASDDGRCWWVYQFIINSYGRRK